ncbi:Transmembrane exosortase (Exosortase_EpsH) [uncultured archaeon]|nr:Transmembrane exosortase (Exosortase_EpsH) [uncultured archaeon]
MNTLESSRWRSKLSNLKSWKLFKEANAFFLSKIKTPFQKKLWNILIFLTRFLVLSLPLHFLLWVNFDAASVQLFVAKAVEKMLLSSGIEAVRNGTFLVMSTKTGALSVEIIKDCVGWKSVLALFGLIFATPGVTLKKRMLGLLAGVPIIFLGNLLRIYATIVVTVYNGLEVWEITHTFLWQEGLIVLVIITWYFWLKICKPQRVN